MEIKIWSSARPRGAGGERMSEPAYVIKKEGEEILKIGFGRPAQNDEIVREAVKELEEMKARGELRGGRLIKLNGPASLPVIVAIAHQLSHIFAYLAIYDPKIGKYVVAIAHGPEYRPGDLID